MNVIDIILGIILLFGLIRGVMRGFIIELASLVALIVGVYGAIHFSYFAFDFLQNQFDWDEQYIQLTAFAITFILIVIFVLFISSFNDKANFIEKEKLKKSILYRPIELIAPTFLPQILSKVDLEMEKNNL